MINMRLKRIANDGNPIPSSMVNAAIALSDKTWECYIEMSKLKEQFDSIDNETYNENYDLFSSIVRDLEKYCNRLSDMSEDLQNYDKVTSYV